MTIFNVSIRIGATCDYIEVPAFTAQEAKAIAKANLSPIRRKLAHITIAQ